MKYHNTIALKYIIDTFNEVLTYSIIIGVLSSFIFNILIIGVHYLFIKKLQYKDVDNYRVNQKREIEWPLTFIDAFNICVQALEVLNFKILDKDISNGYLKAKSKISWKSCGEYIDVNLLMINKSLTKIVVESKPVLNSTIVDYGKNFENIEKIINYFRNL